MKMRAIAVTTAGLLAIACGAAQAGPRDDVLDAMGKCAALTDDKARLGCYDAVAPRLRDALNQPPETLSHPPTPEEQKSWFGFSLGDWFGNTVPPSGQTTPGQFGADRLPPATPTTAANGAPAEPQVLDSITAGVSDYSINPFGKFIVFLDNGQVWKEVDADIAHFNKGAANTVTIERGALGSYNLRINDGNKVFKVTRVK
ncbi:MAG TPA: hypothetical protein VLC29_07100 [Rhizomicrobium sp.]|jgi:hypothetical protein|nr:hypothetical protein [Rhizomicrobium sp.]